MNLFNWRIIAVVILLAGFLLLPSGSVRAGGLGCGDTALGVPGVSAHLYWDETSKPQLAPELWLKVEVEGETPFFKFIKSAPELSIDEIACWTGTQPQYWSPIEWGWRYQGPATYVWLFAGLFVPPIAGDKQLDHEWGLPYYITDVIHWYPVSRKNPDVGRKKDYPPVTICHYQDAEQRLLNEVSAGKGTWRRIHPKGFAFEAERPVRLTPHRDLKIDHTAKGVSTRFGDPPIAVSRASAWCEAA